MSLVKEEEAINVVVRIRPTNQTEVAAGETQCVKATGTDNNEVQVKLGPMDAHVYSCNRCFPPETTQEEFFRECGLINLLDSAIGGYRSTAFAFGQTGAGKTHCIVGPNNIPRPGKPDDGILGSSLVYLFQRLDSLGVKYTLRMSCTEIYKEQVYDLMAEGDDRKTPLQVREHTTDGFFLENCVMSACDDATTACSLLDKAMRHRRIGAHNLNSRSNVFYSFFPNL